jgi:hypothetical protein
VGETDAERRQALKRSGTLEGLLSLNEASWRVFEDEFIFTGNDAKRPSSDPIDISSDDDIPVTSGSTFVMPSPKKSTNHSKGEYSHLCPQRLIY